MYGGTATFPGGHQAELAAARGSALSEWEVAAFMAHATLTKKQTRATFA